MTKRPGYTLIELIFVLATLSLLGAMWAPRYANSMSIYRAQLAAQRIAGDIALTQRFAKTTSVGQSITFVITPSGYSLPNVKGMTGSASSYSVDLTADPYKATLVSASFSSALTLTFDRYGRPSAGGSIVVQSGSMTHTISVDPTTGATTIQ